MKKVAVFISIVFFIFIYIHSTPLFCGSILVTVEKNDSIHDVATKLKQANCIRSKKLFEDYGVLFGVKVQEGLYSISTKKSFFEYLFLFEKGMYRKAVKITIPEGSTNKEIAVLCAEKLLHCDAKRFIEKTKKLEGYLFPNTYEFFGNESEDELINIAQKEFATKTLTLFANLSKQEKENALIVSSILEKEARTEKDMYIVSGILYKRLNIGMALQVDATLFYERGKTSSQLSASDLTKKTPYNTYTNVGLPPTPISNPGIIALQAALNPESSLYLFYLTDNNGTMHYARNHEEHIKNKELYLR